MTLDTNLNNFAIRTATQDKALKTLINGNLADLSSLATTNKASLLAALNELKGLIDAIGSPATINDTTASGTSTYSSNKINSQITAAISALTTGAPGALDTLDELSAALGDDANFAATITTALGNRVRTDTAAQGLDSTQQSNARTNIGAASASALSTLTSNVGTTTTDYVAIFEANL